MLPFSWAWKKLRTRKIVLPLNNAFRWKWIIRFESAARKPLYCLVLEQKQFTGRIGGLYGVTDQLFCFKAEACNVSSVLGNFVLISYFCSLCRGRYLLIRTENFAAMPRVKQILLEAEDSEEPYVIFGSGFPKDRLFTQVKCCFLAFCYFNVCLYICLSLCVSICLYFGDIFLVCNWNSIGLPQHQPC